MQCVWERDVSRCKRARFSLGSCLNLGVPHVHVVALWAGFNLQLQDINTQTSKGRNTKNKQTYIDIYTNTHGKPWLRLSGNLSLKKMAFWFLLIHSSTILFFILFCSIPHIVSTSGSENDPNVKDPVSVVPLEVTWGWFYKWINVKDSHVKNFFKNPTLLNFIKS